VLVSEPGVFRADRGIVKTGGDGMRCGDLAVLVLPKRTCRCPGEPRGALREALMRGEARGVFAELAAAAAGLDANHFYIVVAKELMEEADGVRTAADRRRRDEWAGAFLQSGSVRRASRPMTD